MLKHTKFEALLTLQVTVISRHKSGRSTSLFVTALTNISRTHEFHLYSMWRSKVANRSRKGYIYQKRQRSFSIRPFSDISDSASLYIV